MPASNMVGQSPVPNWRLVLAIGAPVAVGVGLYFYYRSRTNGESGETPSSGKLVSVEDVGSGEQKYSEDSVETAMSAKNKGNKYFKAGRYEDARRHYDRAIQLCDDDKCDDLATYYQNRAATHEMMGDYAACLRDCDHALTLKPRYSKALHRRAKASEHENNLNQALLDSTAVCILEGFQNQQALMLADRVLREIGKQKAEKHCSELASIVPSRQMVNSFLESFSQDPVIQHVNSATEQQINDVNSSHNGWLKAVRALRLGQLEDIIPACTQYVNEVEPLSLSNGQNVNGHEHSVNGNGETPATNGSAAEQESDAVIGQSNDSVGVAKNELLLAYLLRGTFNLLAGNTQQAFEDFNHVINSEHASKQMKINALIKRGSCHLNKDPSEKDNMDKFIEDFRRAVDIDENNQDIYFHRGQILLATGAIEEARNDFERVISLCSSSGNDGDKNITALAAAQLAHIDYKLALQKYQNTSSGDKSQVKLADDNFQQIISQHANMVELRVLYAQALIDAERYEDADRQYLAAIKCQPDHAAVHVNRGHLLLQWRGDLEQAAQLMNTAISLDSRCELAYESLGMIEVQRGQLQRGIDAFDQCLALSNKTEDVSRLFSLRESANAQLTVAKNLQIDLPKPPTM